MQITKKDHSFETKIIDMEQLIDTQLFLLLTKHADNIQSLDKHELENAYVEFKSTVYEQTKGFNQREQFINLKFMRAEFNELFDSIGNWNSQDNSCQHYKKKILCFLDDSIVVVHELLQLKSAEKCPHHKDKKIMEEEILSEFFGVLKWTEEPWKLVLFIYAIYHAKALNNGKASINQLNRLFERLFSVSLKNSSQLFKRICNRKEERDKFWMFLTRQMDRIAESK